MDHYVSEPMEHPRAHGEEGAEFSRADLVFYDVDPTGPSYRALVFLHPGADDPPEYGPDDECAGWFTVFGHGGCFGDDEDHCAAPPAAPDPFDLTFPVGIPRQTKTVSVTETLRNVDGEAFRVTVVPVVTGEQGPERADLLDFGHLRLLTYG
jgi:hypothetical protein